MTRPLAEIEKEAILVAIIDEGGVLPAARALKISKTYVYERLQSYGILTRKIDELTAALNKIRRRSL